MLTIQIVFPNEFLMKTFRFFVYLDGDVFDENVLLDDNDDVLDVSCINSSINDSVNKSMNTQQDDELEEETKLYLGSPAVADDDSFLKDTSKSPEKSIESAATDITDAPQQKKVVLKRKSTSLIESASAAPEQTASTATADEAGAPAKRSKIEPIVMNSDSDTKSTNGSSNVDSNGKTVKWSELSKEELMEIRAKKFGGSPSVDTAKSGDAAKSGDSAKSARAERFGLTAETPAAAESTTTTPKSDAPAKKTTPSAKGIKITFATDVEVLKKRAERFGGSVSTAMVQIENKAKLQKRQERFSGNVDSLPAAIADAVDTPAVDAEAVSAPAESAPAVTAPAVTAPSASDNDERLKARLERFKVAA